MQKTSLFPEKFSPDMAPFVVSGREAVRTVLDEVLTLGVPSTAYFDEGFLSIEPRLVAIDENAAVLTFETPDGEWQTERALISGRMTFVAFVDGVKVQFSTERARLARFAGRLAFQVPFPQRALRLQRRARARARPSRISPMECFIGSANGPSRLQGLPVLDISDAGVALLGDARRSTFATGQTLPNCTLDLAGEGTVIVDLLVRSAERLEAQRGTRYSCEFVELAGDGLARLRRYMTRLTGERGRAVTNELAR